MSTADPCFERPTRFSKAEWEARVNLAAMYRIFAFLKWDESIYNHISLRMPGEDAFAALRRLVEKQDPSFKY